MKYIKIAIIMIVLFIVIGFVYYEVTAADSIRIDPEKLYSVAYVIDGDTVKVKVDSHIITIRLLGINTPETVDPRKPVECYGHEASDETKSLLSGKSVRLMLNPNREVKDKYGRYLAYIYREDGLFINESLIDDGFAREYTYGSPYMFQSEFKSHEEKAKELKKGLWSACVQI